MRSKWIVLATLGLLAGAVGPHSLSAAEPARRWINAVKPSDGKTYQISGWLDAAGHPQFDPREYPEFVPKSPPAPDTKAPAPDIAPAPETPGPKSNWPYPQLGVIQSKIPKPVAGQAWYGGNAVKVIESDGNTPRARPPDVHLTVIGDEAAQTRTRAKLAADPQFQAMSAAMGDRLAVQFYGPTDPMVARVGLVDGGTPDIVVQDATGKERKRFHSDPGPLPIVAEIRKADPSYKPGRDEAAGGIPLSGPAQFLAVVVVGLVVFAVLPRLKANPS